MSYSVRIMTPKGEIVEGYIDRNNETFLSDGSRMPDCHAVETSKGNGNKVYLMKNGKGVLMHVTLDKLSEKIKAVVETNDTSIIENRLYGEMFNCVSNHVRIKPEEETPDISLGTDQSPNKQRKENYFQNIDGLEIEIDYGDGQRKELLEDVFLRDATTQIDTSGKPLSKVFQFIAKDAKEVD